MELIKLKDSAILASKRAGDYLNSQKDSKKEILSEIGRDIKLEIDQNTEKLIREELRSTGIEVLGEEFGGGKSESLQWVIDPLDGTANYFRGLDQCCVSIALLDGAEALIGIIYNFNTNEIYSAVKGQGAFLNGLPIKVSDITEKNKASLTTGFPASESLESSMKFLEGLKEWKKIRMFGSAALSCAYVASGKCDFYAEKGVYLWDFAAGICLVNEAGGRVQFSKIDSERYSVKFDNNCL
jgi:myo-inositol-1(or 4)-monophosphatase